jgi:hypothetical protein
MAQTQLQKDERSLGDLFSELAAETGTLVRQEVALAQVELTEKATVVGKNVGYLAVGGAVWTSRRATLRPRQKLSKRVLKRRERKWARRSTRSRSD